MLFKETVSDSTLALLKQLMEDAFFHSFRLVGGTALSLQIGHRISIDLDLFSEKTFEESEVADYLRQNYSFELDFMDKETIKGEIEGVKIDCIAHKYHWLNTFSQEEGIRLAGLDDIAAMKLNAIAGNGTRIKDFIDIACLSDKRSLKQMLEAYHKKYASNPVLPLKALTFFDDINFSEPIKMTGTTKFDWKKTAKRLNAMLKYPDKIFE
ncbi:nucleotidyl transferase AbiEii/AbiGii toxin family protein [Massilibacteroides sp.]|uniref:nucleotidyl transferase AbiEii/AbiGii toxin family protein n=1 Tax=Massilibacteroides sp. TaxID=2034766 RepID=UPI00261A5FA6|nr:nucleotidyl transferase AbiEii/AbiGii toxin family protein [Massilibacteroides sp.]MDD4515981.1 nucleotidyl transferase AbiEii/AbiGii toxin family protein [Massilibacteroides sp.]